MSNKIGLGTVQFGVNYGISNTGGQTPLIEVRKILETAIVNNIQILDTSIAYGNSQKVLGEAIQNHDDFKIVTKIPSFQQDKFSKQDALSFLDQFQRALEEMNTQTIYGLLFHHSDDLKKPGAEYLVEAMLKLKERGLIQKMGLSTYQAEVLQECRRFFPYNLVQVPLNIFDQRMHQKGILKALKEMDVEIHTRSTFLQGLLLMNPDSLPEPVQHAKPNLEHFHELLTENKLSAIQAAYHFVASIPEVDHIIMGVNTNEQLLENIELQSQGIADMTAFYTCGTEEANIINPSLWK